MYSAIVQDHVSNPRNVGPLETATHQGVAGIPGEGPYMVLWFEIDKDRIVKAAYQTYGCPAAVASASMTVELVTGRSVAEALHLREPEIIQALEGLPEGKEHCATLSVRALQAAFDEQANADS